MKRLNCVPKTNLELRTECGVPVSSSFVLTTGPCCLLVRRREFTSRSLPNLIWSHTAVRKRRLQWTSGRGMHIQKAFALCELKTGVIFPFILELSPEMIKAVINFSCSLHVIFVSHFQHYSCAHRINYWNIILFIHPPVTEIGSLKANLALISSVCLGFSPQYCHRFWVSEQVTLLCSCGEQKALWADKDRVLN